MRCAVLTTLIKKLQSAQMDFQPENYIIIKEEDGSYSAFIKYANFDSKEDAEKGLQMVFDLMGYTIKPNVTLN